MPPIAVMRQDLCDPRLHATCVLEV